MLTMGLGEVMLVMLGKGLGDVMLTIGLGLGRLQQRAWSITTCAALVGLKCKCWRVHELAALGKVMCVRVIADDLTS
jgi:hypothetical protein